MRSYLPLTLVTVLMLTSVSSCRYSEHNKTFTYSNDWTIDYPSFFRKSKYVYPGSELQLSNGYRDTYVFVREVITRLDQQSLSDSLVAKLYGSLEDPKFEMDSTYALNGATFATKKLTGILQDKRMFYLVSIIESEGTLFQFSGWMFNHKRELWEEDYLNMLHSWRRL